jgi:dipeptidyl aminopeptidase/acylaminoacyl peptidase
MGQSEQMHAAFKQHQVDSDFLVIEGGGHGFRGADAERANKATAEWFAKHLTARN